MSKYQNPLSSTEFELRLNKVKTSFENAISGSDYQNVFKDISTLYVDSNGHRQVYYLLLEMLDKIPVLEDKIFHLIFENSDDTSVEQSIFRVRRSKAYRDLNLAKNSLDYDKVFQLLTDLFRVDPDDNGVLELFERLADKSAGHISKINTLFQKYKGKVFRSVEPPVELPAEVRRLIAMATSTFRVGEYERTIEICREAILILDTQGISIPSNLDSLMKEAEYRNDQSKILHKGLALLEKGDWQGSLQFFTNNIDNSLGNNLFTDIVRRLKIALAKETEISKQLYNLAVPHQNISKLIEIENALLELPEILGEHAAPTEHQLGLINVIKGIKESTKTNFLISAFGNPLTDVQFQSDVFMVMPFRKAFDSIYRDIITPSVVSSGLTIKRGDDFYSKHSIVLEIWSAICHSKFLIADCTGKNANVFYELGLAHAIGKPVVMLTQKIDDIPFDLRHLRFITYTTDIHGLEKLQLELKIAINRILEDLKTGTSFYSDRFDENSFLPIPNTSGYSGFSQVARLRGFLRKLLSF